jgi:hypothetical protein
VSLSTFYIYDKANMGKPDRGMLLARGGCGHGGGAARHAAATLQGLCARLQRRRLRRLRPGILLAARDRRKNLRDSEGCF